MKDQTKKIIIALLIVLSFSQCGATSCTTRATSSASIINR